MCTQVPVDARPTSPRSATVLRLLGRAARPCAAALCALSLALAGCGPEAASPDVSEPAPEPTLASAATLPFVEILNPAPVSMVMTSPAVGHHTTKFGEQLSFDGANLKPGTEIRFRAKPVYPAVAVRGTVVEGGSDLPVVICRDNNASHGGWGVWVRVEAQVQSYYPYASLSWVEVGWVLYGHVENMAVRNGAPLVDGTLIGEITDEVQTPDEIPAGTNPCSTGPHIHMGLKSAAGFLPCYASYVNVEGAWISASGLVGRIGGASSAISVCPMLKMRGDVNKDGAVTAVDALLVAQRTAGLPTPSLVDLTAADTTCDGAVDINDARLISRYAAGLIQGFDCYTY